MKALRIEFTNEVRTGPSYSDRKNRLQLSDKGFAADNAYPCGTIDCDDKARMIVITNPRPDPETKEPVISRIPYDRLIYYTPLTAEQEKIHYAPRKAEEAA